MILKYYELKWKIKYFIDDCKWFFPNVWKFRKELTDFRPWDYQCNLELFKRSLELTYELIDNHGKEEESSKRRTLASLKLAIDIINKINDDDRFNKLEDESLFQNLGNLISRKDYGMRSWWD